MRILVAGATGTLGHALVRALHERGHDVVAHGRDRRKLAHLHDFVKETRPADVTKPFELSGICRGVECVVSAVGLVGVRALGSSQTHEQVDHQGNLNLIREAERAGVGKFVFVSAQHADTPEDVALLVAKRKVEDALRKSSLDWLVVRPTVYFEQVRQGLLEPARRGLVAVVGEGTTKVSPVDAEDVATWIAGHLDESNRVVELGGPDVLTYDEMARMSFEVLGKRPRVVHVPPSLLSTAASLSRRLPMAASGELSYIRFATTHDHVAPPAGEHHLRDSLLAKRPE